MTTTKILDFMKLLKAGNNKRTIEYVDRVSEDGFDRGYEVGYNIGNLDGQKEAKLLWPLYEDESCIGGIHDD